mgnify:CR=1 FL=1
MAWCAGLSHVKGHLNQYAKRIRETGESLYVLRWNKPYLKISPVDDTDFLEVHLHEAREIRACENPQTRNRENPSEAE